ncbi:uncharacterized protein EAF01_001037 [Botrytis porri]|uniref:Uncharacterized protein n=1 Tax=Botrytis porri TaxID=87229 RepID=A0A4Z1K7B1_9HELO|nr:uncharacterized protein EAF01_001037 [Botrytis porri]KAF7914631.1 hypothetical protein EAF01_001037 [Botrytis porri]TGO81548.1 hypothetical protein BPOR_1109g00030 [Botrytis porri]
MHFLTITLFAILPFFSQVNGARPSDISPLCNSNGCTCSLAMMWQNNSTGLPDPPVRARVFNKNCTFISKPNITQENMGKYPINLTSPKLLSNFSIFGEDSNKHPEFTYGANFEGGEHCGFQTMKYDGAYYNVCSCTFACEGPKAEWWVALSGANRTKTTGLK